MLLALCRLLALALSFIWRPTSTLMMESRAENLEGLSSSKMQVFLRLWTFPTVRQASNLVGFHFMGFDAFYDKNINEKISFKLNNLNLRIYLVWMTRVFVAIPLIRDLGNGWPFDFVYLQNFSDPHKHVLLEQNELRNTDDNRKSNNRWTQHCYLHNFSLRKLSYRCIIIGCQKYEKPDKA